MSQFTIIDSVLNMYHTAHSTRSLHKLIVLIERKAYSESCQRSTIKPFGKIFVIFNYFCKKLNLKSLRWL